MSDHSAQQASFPVDRPPSDATAMHVEAPHDASPVPPRKRRRPALSCIECRRRKVKCDRNEPCNHCIAAKHPCEYDDDPRRLARKQSALNLPHSATSTVSNSWTSVATDEGTANTMIATSVAGSDSAATLAEALPVTYETPTSSIGQTGDSQGTQQSVRELMDRVHNLEHALAESIKSNQARALPRPLPPPSTSMNKTRLYGRSHVANLYEHFKHMDFIRTDPRFGKGTDINEMLYECKELARTVKALRPDPTAVSDLNSLMPPRAIANELIVHYFRTFESCYRVLHEPSFHKDYSRYWSSINAPSSLLVVKILLVMAMGSIFYQNEVDELDVRAKAKEWVYAAQAWLNGPSEKRQLTLESLQVHCLILLARQVCAVSGDLVWISEGSLVRSAIQMGYHRDPSCFPKVGLLEGELRRRLWATILELNIQSSVDSGMPPMISLDDYDCEPPLNLNDGDLDENMSALPPSKPMSTSTQTSFQVMLSRSLPTRLEVARQLNNFRAQPTYEQTLELGTEITAYLLETTQTLESATPRHSALRRNLLDLHIRRFLLLLHIPYALRAKTDPHFYFSRKITLETAIHMLTYSGGDSPVLATPNSAHTPVFDDFMRMLTLSGGIFRGTLHPPVVLDLEFIRQTEEYRATGVHSLTTRSTLHQVVEANVCMAKRRLEMSETNVREYIYTSMSQAQILALEQGEKPDEAMLAAARRTTADALAIMRWRVERERASIERNRSLTIRGRQRSSLPELSPRGVATESTSAHGVVAQSGRRHETAFHTQAQPPPPPLLPSTSSHHDVPQSSYIQYPQILQPPHDYGQTHTQAHAQANGPPRIGWEMMPNQMPDPSAMDFGDIHHDAWLFASWDGNPSWF